VEAVRCRHEASVVGGRDLDLTRCEPGVIRLVSAAGVLLQAPSWNPLAMLPFLWL
jgi:hypothetical protein